MKSPIRHGTRPTLLIGFLAAVAAAILATSPVLADTVVKHHGKVGVGSLNEALGDVQCNWYMPNGRTVAGWSIHRVDDYTWETPSFTGAYPAPPCAGQWGRRLGGARPAPVRVQAQFTIVPLNQHDRLDRLLLAAEVAVGHDRPRSRQATRRSDPAFGARCSRRFVERRHSHDERRSGRLRGAGAAGATSRADCDRSPWRSWKAGPRPTQSAQR